MLRPLAPAESESNEETAGAGESNSRQRTEAEAEAVAVAGGVELSEGSGGSEGRTLRRPRLVRFHSARLSTLPRRSRSLHSSLTVAAR